MRFANFDADAFLRDHWQKKPLLIRNPWTQWQNPLEPDELAGLCCEPYVESRLIAQSTEELEVEHGPLPEDRFGRLGKAPWTLLVQAVDHHIAEVAGLLDPFRFIPNWRIDDVMVSYATDGGGVGAHYDHYDVFLVQGLGQRRWQLGGLCDADTPLLEHDDLRLLANFEVKEEWVLDPGDILYIPPRVAHKGVAVGDDCMTYSVGFRAPSQEELVEGWAESIAERSGDDDRYGDPGLKLQSNAGEITPDAIAQLHAMVTQSLDDRQAFAEWFGKYATSPKNPNIDWEPEQPFTDDDMRNGLNDAVPIIRNPASRFAYICADDDAVHLMVDGRSTHCSGDLAKFARDLCGNTRLATDPGITQSAEVCSLVLELLNRGSIAFDYGDVES
jgi:50S ribosomal protein L16 3-hydroxylase